MKLNEQLQPVIRPTKDPSIMTRKAHYGDLPSGPLLHESPVSSSQEAPSYTSHETHQTSPAVDAVKALFENRSSSSTTNSADITAKFGDFSKVVKTIAIVYVAIILFSMFGGLIAAILEFADSETTQTTEPMTNLVVQDSPDSVDDVAMRAQAQAGELVEIENSCLSISLPDYPSYQGGLNWCELSFLGGSTYLLLNQASGSDYRVFENVQQLEEAIGDSFVKSFDVNGRTVLVSDESYYGYTSFAYYVWIGDLDYTAASGDKYYALTIYLFESGDFLQDDFEKVIKSTVVNLSNE